MGRAQPYDRDAALAAATALFWRKGYHATSLKDLEAALSMKPGSIYAAFKSKEALFLESLDRYFVAGRDELSAIVETTTSPLCALADFLLSFADTERTGNGPYACMVVKTMLDATLEDAEIAARSRQYLDDMQGEIVRGFQRAKELGELSADADIDLLAHRFQAELTALRIEAQRGCAPEKLRALAESMALDVERLRAAPSA